MIISLINHSSVISDAEVQQVIRAVNRQIREDFEPYWSFGATLRLEGAIGRRPSYFSLGEQAGRRNDFLGHSHVGQPLASFGMNPGGYLNLFDPKSGKWEQAVYESDEAAQLRRKLKSRLKAGRGYRRSHPGRA